jgi:hypothetical protein
MKRSFFLENLRGKHHEIVEDPDFTTDTCVKEDKSKIKKQSLCSTVFLTEDFSQRHTLR